MYADEPTITIPQNLFNNMLLELRNIHTLYEQIDHFQAMEEVKNHEVDTYTSTDDFLQSLDEEWNETLLI